MYRINLGSIADPKTTKPRALSIEADTELEMKAAVAYLLSLDAQAVVAPGGAAPSGSPDPGAHGPQHPIVRADCWETVKTVLLDYDYEPLRQLKAAPVRRAAFMKLYEGHSFSKALERLERAAHKAGLGTEEILVEKNEGSSGADKATWFSAGPLLMEHDF